MRVSKEMRLVTAVHSVVTYNFEHKHVLVPRSLNALCSVVIVAQAIRKRDVFQAIVHRANASGHALQIQKRQGAKETKCREKRWLGIAGHVRGGAQCC